VAQLGTLTAAAAGLGAGDRWEVLTGNRLALHLQPSPIRRYLEVGVGELTPDDLLAILPRDSVLPSTPDRPGLPASDLLRRWLDPAAARAVGKGIDFPRRFPEVLTTQGRLGETGAPYEVDLLTAPEKNSGKSWLRFGGFDFFSDGTRAAVCTWSGDVWIVSGIDASLSALRWQRFATGLFQPLGLKIVRDQIYVLGRDQITRLVDENGDGEADTYECFNNDVSVTPNFHEFALDLHTDPEGNFYFTKGAPLLGTEYWDPIGQHNGSVLKVSPDGRQLERYATGLRAPNGSGVGPHGEVTCSDNEGIWTPVCRLNWVRPGGFYGAMGLEHQTTPPVAYDPPLCWLPYAIDNSSGGQVWTSDRFGPLSGQLIHLSYGKCRAFCVLKEEVGGMVQGGVVPLPWKFDSSAMRGRTNPKDGQLYVCGLKGWQTTAPRDGALHRIRCTGKPMAGLTGVRVLHQGVELSFNAPLDSATAADPQNWNVQWWNYLWSRKYGSDLYSVAEPKRVTGRKGELRGDPVAVDQIKVSDDGQTVTLLFREVRPVMQWMLKAALKTAKGADLPVEYYGTINAVPAH
jgi:hypothetical protein